MNTGWSTATKKIAASYVAELQALENALASTTAMPQALFEDSYARHAIGMFLDTYGMTQKQWSELRPTLGSLLQYRS